MEEWVEVLNDDIEIVVQKLGGRRDRNAILRWLSNFEEDSRLIGIDILRNMLYVTEDDLRFECSKILRHFEQNYCKNQLAKIYIVPIAKYGKSATLLMYYIQKTDVFKRFESQNQVAILSNESLVKETIFQETDCIIFMDDFFGTGKSILKGIRSFYSKCHESANSISKCFAASIYYMKQAESTLKEHYPQINLIGNRHYKIFGDDPLIFGSHAISLKYKKFTQELSQKKSLYRIKEIYHNLGFDNSEALIAFPYVTPNNTLPIIWSNRNTWKPLLPRDEDAIFWLLKEKKANLAVMGAKNILGLKLSDNPPFGLKRTNFIILGIIRFLSQGASFPRIIQQLGIRLADLDEILGICIKQGYLDEHNKLTDKGRKENESIKKKIIDHNNKRDNRFQAISLEYIPKSFSG